jgi:carboxyl-terminal processing protease
MGSKLKTIGLVSTGIVAGVLLSLAITATAQRAADRRSPLPIEELRQFTDVFGAIKSNYVEPVDDRKLITEAINGMVSGLDPHSAYLDEKAYKELRESTQGRFGGLGIEVGSEDGYVKVISPIEDTPAFRAGVKAGDLIVKIDGVDVKGMSVNDAVGKLRGAPQTKVTIGVTRKGEKEEISFTLTREVIRVQSVRAKVVEPGYAYVRITQFQDPTVEDLGKKLDEMSKEGPLKGLVLDLRNNPGGVLPGAIGVSAAFLPRDALIVSTKGQLQEAQAKYFAVKDEYQRSGEDVLRRVPAVYKNLPMVVIVNGGSASASEIVAGALQDYKRATVIGSQTFGKGSVQTILPLPPERKTGVKLTISRYYTPNGRSIQAKGIEPDLQVDDTVEGNLFDFPREVDLAKHISNDRQAEAAARKGNSAEEEKRRAALRKPLEFGSKEDFQLQQALNFLKGAPVVTRKTMTAAATGATPKTPAAATAPAAAASTPATGK